MLPNQPLKSEKSLKDAALIEGMHQSYAEQTWGAQDDADSSCVKMLPNQPLKSEKSLKDAPQPTPQKWKES